MKALIRNNSDPILETMDIPFINWATGAPLTSPDWFGGPYILVNDYVPEDPADDFAEDLPTAAASEESEPEDTVVIDGVVYRRA